MRLSAMRAARGFTLIELMVVMAIIALLVGIAAPRYFQSVERAREGVLKTNLNLLRDAIDKHYADTGRYPETLDELVSKRYLRSLPRDPVTSASDTWVAVPPPPAELGRIYDVHSGSEATALDGSAFNTW